jgi:hypothetical protein
VRYLGTNFCLTLGAWRLRFVLALEDAPDDDESPNAERPQYRSRTEQRGAGAARVDSRTAAHWN